MAAARDERVTPSTPTVAWSEARLEVEVLDEALGEAHGVASVARSERDREPAPSAVVRRAAPASDDATPATSASPEVVEGADAVASLGTSATSNDAPAAPASEPRKIDLGLDGSLFRAELLESARRPPPARRRVVQDDWSAIAVRIASEQSGPREGSALVTIEWDAEGRLRSVVTSAQSSPVANWEKLADALRRTLSKRPKLSAEKRALRLVYLVKSELVVPHNQRSVLPKIQNGSFEAIRDEQLPPAVTLNFGVKADTSTPAERLVSVTLASSQVL